MIKFIVIIILACIAASGTFPFGWRFAALFHLTNPSMQIATALLFALAATLANAALGAYSLLHAFHHKFNLITILLSLLAAIPMGFICFAGYEFILMPLPNILISFAVTVVNAAINYTALRNAVISLWGFFKGDAENSTVKYLAINRFGHVLRAMAIFMGILVSVTISLACIDRLVTIFTIFKIPTDLSWIVSYVIGILLWIPNAALFANSTQRVASIGYKFVRKLSINCQNIKSTDVLLFLFASLSGGAFAQMTLEFSALDRNIPTFLKSNAMQLFIHNIMVPLGFVAIATVNLVALSRLLPFIKAQFLSDIHNN